MKKFLFFLMAVFTALSSQAWTVYFTNPNGWSTVYCYVYGGSAGEALGKWSGTEMTKDGDIYTISYDGDEPSKIIFNNGSSGGTNQTGNLDFVAGATYNFYGTEDAELNTYTVYFDNSASNWDEVYVYTFSPELFGEWAGTKIEANDDGLYVASYEATSAQSFGGLIFSDGKGGTKGVAQTNDLQWEEGATYNVKGIITEGGDDPVEDEYPELYLRGENFDNWAVLEANKMTREENVYTLTLEDGLTGEWKISDDSWSVSFGATKGANEIALNKNVDAWKGSSINFITNTTGKTVVTFTYGSDPSTIRVEAEEEEEPVEVEYTKVSLKSAGVNGDWKYTEYTVDESKTLTVENVVVGSDPNHGVNLWLFENGTQTPYEFTFSGTDDLGEVKELTKYNGSDSYIKLYDNAVVNLYFDFTGDVPTVTVSRSDWKISGTYSGTFFQDNIEYGYEGEWSAVWNADNTVTFLWDDPTLNGNAYGGETWMNIYFNGDEVGAEKDEETGKWTATSKNSYSPSSDIQIRVFKPYGNGALISAYVVYGKWTTPLKNAGFAYANNSYNHHRMAAIAAEKQDGDVVNLSHEVEFGGAEGENDNHYNLVSVSIAAASDCNFSDLNKEATVSALAAKDGTSSYVTVNAYTAGIYTLTVKHDAVIEADGCNILPSEVRIPVRVTPSVRGVRLAFNWTDYMIDNDGHLAIALDKVGNYEETNNDQVVRTWTQDKCHLTTYEADIDGVEIWWRYENEVVADEEQTAPVAAFVGAREASALDVTTETNSTDGYTKYDSYTTAPSLLEAQKNGGLSVVLVQNGIIGAPETVTVYSDTTNIDSGATDVEAVEVAEDVEAVYYTLDGVKVANPERGLYIVVKNGKAEKVYVK